MKETTLISGRFSNFASKIPFLKKRFRSFSANTSYNYKKEDHFNPFASNQDTREISHNLNPLLKLSASSKSNIRYENAINHKFSRKFEINKQHYPDESGDTSFVDSYRGPQKLPVYIHKSTDNQTKVENIRVSDVFSLSYDIKTQKGIQFWKWFVKLENNLKLKFTTEVTWTRNTRFLTTFDEEGNIEPNKPERDLDEWLFKARPEISYNFTRKIDGKFFTQYIREQEFQTVKNDTRHEIEVHSEFTMRF